MNQILMQKQINKRYKKFYKIQFIVSIFVVLILFLHSIQNWRKRKEIEQISNIMNQSFQMETIYLTQKTMKDVPYAYFGKITIPKINLEYSIFNECNDELLKVLPCKFYGVNLGEKGNICIAGHNYEDHRFFGDLTKLKKGDAIYLEDLSGNQYRYTVYDKYKIQPNDFQCLKAIQKYDLTLITCDNLNDKRLVVRANR